MIKIVRPSLAPEILLNEGAAAKYRLCDLHQQGCQRFEFDSKIYGDPSVKKKLINAQHHKCCFCEAKVTHVAYGDVEHFRPKAGYRQKPGDPLERPGYYWLAYDWDNLLFACQICNQRYKRNLFPLTDPRNRASSHHQNHNGEAPVFIDPSQTDPERFITFRAEIPYAINGNLRGEQTIPALGLDRANLTTHRRRQYEIVKCLYNLVSIEPDSVEGRKAQSLIESYTQPESEYSSMFKAAVASGFRY